MSTFKELWWDKMIEKHGSREEVSRLQSVAAKTRKITGTGGFYKNPEAAKIAGKKGGQNRWKSKES
jgi:general stress protein YciG